MLEELEQGDFPTLILIGYLHVHIVQVWQYTMGSCPVSPAPDNVANIY